MTRTSPPTVLWAPSAPPLLMTIRPGSTHCKGALATAGYGTALGIVRAAREAGKQISVVADETRPFLQGARLTAWELKKDRIPVTLIADNMAGFGAFPRRHQLRNRGD